MMIVVIVGDEVRWCWCCKNEIYTKAGASTVIHANCKSKQRGLAAPRRALSRGGSKASCHKQSQDRDYSKGNVALSNPSSSSSPWGGIEIERVDRRGHLDPVAGVAREESTLSLVRPLREQ